MNARAGVVVSQVAWGASLPFTAFTAPTAELAFKGSLAGFVVAAFASFLCDLDHPQSTIGRYFPWWVRKILGGHRMGAHSIFMVSGCWWLTGYLLDNPIIANAVVVGMVSHILLDMLTVQGVALLYPLVRRKFRIGWMVTGSDGEDLFVFIMKGVGALVFAGYCFIYLGGY